MIKKEVIFISTIAGLGLSMATVQPTTIKAATWHTKAALPAKLRHIWTSKYDRNHKLKIYKKHIIYTWEKPYRVERWAYAGNGMYKVKVRGNYSIILFHYFNTHKLSANSRQHSYFR